MSTYKMNEIVNNFNQPIYYFSKQSGNTELEKYYNFLSQWPQTYKIYNLIDINGKDLTCVVMDKSHSVMCFNHLDQLIASCDDLPSSNLSEVQEFLQEEGII